MKKIIIPLLMIAATGLACNQSKEQCCNAGSSASMSAFAADKSFRDAHEPPLALDYKAQGKMISFSCDDGKKGSAYFVASAKKSNQYLMVFHEWWGLNNWIKQMADMYHDSLSNMNIIALDLYDGQVASTAEEAGKLMKENNNKRSVSIINGALNFSGKESQIATVGWCFGGGWSLQGALLCGAQSKACVVYYGMPETDVSKLNQLSCEVLFIWPNKDQWVNENVKNTFVENMQEAGKTLIVKEYAADHAFANPSNPKHDKESSADAQRITLSFLNNAFNK